MRLGLFLFVAVCAASGQFFSVPPSRPPGDLQAQAAPTILRFTGAPVPMPNGWQFTWTSEAGRAYTLQRWTSDELSIRAVPLWTDVATVQAAGFTTSSVDPTPGTAARRFYRVILVDAGDTDSPVVSPVRAVATTVQGEPAVRLSVTVQDSSPVTQVVFYNGPTEIGQASSEPDDNWSVLFSDPNIESTSYQYLAKAVDAEGNEGFSAVLRYGQPVTNRFARLDASGRPTGEYLEPSPDGTLPPFEYRPEDQSAGGTQRGLFVQFPEGAKLVTVEGKEFIEFTEASAQFGASSAIKINVSTATGQLSTLAQGAPKLLPLGAVTAPELAAALGFAPEDGVPIVLFEKFPLTWRAGVLEDFGIRGARFSLPDIGIPLPLISGDYPEFVLPLDNASSVALPFYGEFAFPDGSETPPAVRTSPADPAWVTLNANGTIGYRNRSELRLPGGGKVRADIDLDFPVYRIAFFADRVHVPMIDSLADLLPSNPEACLPVTVAEAALTTAARCLESFDQAYYLFSASAAASAPIPADLMTNNLPAPPDDVATAVSLLEAWAYRVVAPASFQLGAIQELLAHTRESGAAATDLESVLRYRRALALIKKAVDDGNVSATAGEKAELEAALEEMEAAALLRARQPEAIRSLSSMQESVNLLLQALEISQQFGLASNPELLVAMEDLLRVFTENYVASLGVQGGQFTSGQNATIGEMNRFTVFQSLHDLLDLMSDAAILGIDGQVTAPLDETFSQLALRLFSLAAAALDDAELAGDVPGFNYAMEDILDLMALRQMALFPNVPALANVPTVANLPAYANRLGALLEADLAKPYPNRSYVNEAMQLRGLLRILREIPPTVTFAAEPFERAFDRMTVLLAAEMTRLPGNDNLAELVELLQAGILHEELRLRFVSAAAGNWENARLALVVARIAAVAQPRRSWSDLHKSVQILFREAARHSAAGDQPRRKLYLAQAPVLLNAARNVAQAVWQDEESRRATDSALFLADLILPGDIYVDKVAGAGSFNLKKGEFGGSFKGQLRLPKFASTLEIVGASFKSAGEIELTAHGSVGLPLSNPVHQLSIPRRRPLHIKWTAADGPAFSGGLSLALQNGMRFGGYISLEPPLYQFGMEAEGLRLDLADKVTLYKPVLPDTGVFTKEVATSLNEYFKSLNAQFEPLAKITAELPEIEPGTPPDFEPPAIVGGIDDAIAWANSIQADAVMNINRSYANTLPSLKARLSAFASQARRAREDLDQRLGSLEARTARFEQISSYNRSIGTIAEAAGVAADRQLLGEDLGNFAFSPEVQEALAVARTNTLALLENTNNTRDLKIAEEVLTTVLDLAATEASLGVDETVLEFAAAFQAQAQAEFFIQLGFNPQTGSLTNETRFGARTTEEMEQLMERVTDLQADSALLGAELPQGAYDTARGEIALRLRARALADLRRLPPDQWEARARSIEIVSGVTVLGEQGAFPWPAQVEQLDGSMDAINPEVEFEALATLAEGAERERRKELRRVESDRLFRLLLQLRSKVNRELAQDILDGIKVDLRRTQEALEDLAGEPWPREKLREGVGHLQRLLVLAEGLEELDMQAELIELQTVVLPNLTSRYMELAEAEKAWWHATEYTRLLLAAADRKAGDDVTLLANTFVGAAARSIRAADRIAQAFILLRPQFEPVDLSLPGDLVVRRVFGNVFYNSETEVLGGSFGGRLEFPNLENAFFEIIEASIATDGGFAFNARTGGPLPFSDLKLTAALQASGTANGLLNLGGSGELFVPTTTSTQIFAVTANYNTSSNLLSFFTTAQNIDWQLTEDFVLLDGGIGIELSTEAPAGRLRLSGSAGLFARSDPLPQTVGTTNFHLVVSNLVTTLHMETNGLAASLDRGTLLLPESFSAQLCTINTLATNAPRAGIALNAVNPIALHYTDEPESVRFTGELNIQNVGIQVPGLPGMALGVCQAKLLFLAGQLPILTNLNAYAQIPLPGQTSVVEVVSGAWGLAGLPTGSIGLASNLDLYKQDGFRFTLLGSQSALCPTGTGLTIVRTNNATLLTLRGGIEFGMPASLISDNAGGEIGSSACGTFTIRADTLPQMVIDSIAFTNTLLRLGGTNGFEVHNASLQLAGLPNLFSPSAEAPFEVRLGGQLIIPQGPGLQMQGAKFTLDGGLLPRFSVSNLVATAAADWELISSLPFRVTKAGVSFLNPDLPLPGLLSLTNVQFIVSAGISLPPGPTPLVGGDVHDLLVWFTNGLPQFSLDAFKISIQPTQFLGDDVPLTLGGDLFIGGLNDPPNYLFSGKLNGNYKGNAIEGLVAMDLCGLRGICFGLAGAEVSIPIGYGFVLTGAKGGVSFANSNEDPCDFLTYMPIDPITGKPTGSAPCRVDPPAPCGPPLTWEELLVFKQQQGIASQSTRAMARAALEPAFRAAAAEAEALGQEPFPCPVLGECPPASVNILCMPHPDSQNTNSPFANKVILKFSSIDEPTLNFIGITPEFIAQLTPNFSVDKTGMAVSIAHSLRQFVDASTPRTPFADDPAAEQWARDADALIEQTLNNMELAFANTLICAFEPLPASGADLAALIYGTIRDAVWAGLPCPDETIKLTGSVSYTGLSVFASITGGVVLSTTGSAGVIGSVNVFGIPVGTARIFVNVTDANGNPQVPSLCGEIIGALGPLEIGTLSVLEDCPGCLDRLFNAFPTLFAQLGNNYVYTIMNRARPELANPSWNALQHLAALVTEEEKAAFLAAMMNTPPTDPNGAVSGAFLDFLVTIADSIIPRVASCGEVSPKIFGIPLTGGNDLISYKSYAGPRLVDGIPEGFLYQEEYAFSPSYFIANFVGGTGGLFPPVDYARAAMSVEFPTIGQIIRDSFTKPAPQFLAERTEDFLKNATTVLEYRLAPLGMELGRAAGRFILPSLDHHPRGSDPKTLPWERGQNLPDRLEVLLAALGDKDQENAVNRMADVGWKGEGDADFGLIFAGSDYAAAVSGKNLSLVDDYFPHGGMLGAGTLDFPALLANPIPESFFVLTNPDGSITPLQRFEAAMDFINNHLLKTERVGELAFYIPAPNPPVAGFPTTAQELMESLRGFVPDDPFQFETYYPKDKAFMSGWLDTPILGIPTIRSRISAEPETGKYHLMAEVPPDSWFSQMIGSAQFEVILESNPEAADTITNLFAPFAAELAALNPQQSDFQTRVNAIVADLAQELADGLPKAAAKLTGQTIRIPFPAYSPAAPLTPQLTVATIDSAAFEAYSPLYNDPSALGSTLLDRVRREGGIAMKGDFNFANGLVNIPNAEFAVFPTLNSLGLPSVAGRFELASANLLGVTLGPLTQEQAREFGVTSRNALVEFSSDHAMTALRAHGSISQFNLGPVFTLSSLDGTSIGASANFETTTSTLQGSLRISPAQLESPLFAPGATLRIHGARADEPFTYRTDGPWNASVTLEGLNALDLRAGAETVLRIQGTALQSANVSRDSRGAVTMTLNLRSGSSFTAFPGRTYQQNFTLNAAAAVQISSDGQFTFDAEISDQIVGGVTLRGRVTLTNTPDLRFTLGGVVTLPALGGMSIGPRVSATPLEGHLLVERNRTGAIETGVRVKPARLSFTALLGASQSFLIDGGAAGEDFTFSTSGPWSARLTLDGAAPLELRAGNVPVFRTDQSNLATATLSRNNLGVIRITANVAADSTLTAFPTQPFAQSVRLAASSTLSIATTGAFSLSSTVAGAQIFSGLPITGLATGASVNVTQNGFTMTGTASGGVLTLVPVTGSVTSTVSITASGLNLTTSASVTVQELVYNQFRISPLSGTTFTATLNNNGLTIPSGLRIRYRGSSLGTFNLPSFTIPANGNYSFSVGPVSAGLNGFNLASVNFTFQRQSGVISIPSFAGSLAIPRPGGTLANLTVTGNLNSNGAFSLRGTMRANVSLVSSGVPVNTLGTGATLTFTQNSLTLQGALTGGVLAQVPISGTAADLLTISSNGTTTLSGSVTVQPILATPFRIDSASGGNMNSTMNNSGLSFSGARLRVPGILGSVVTLPAFTMSANGNFTRVVNPPNMAIAGLPCASISFTLRRQNGLMSLSPMEANLNIPGFTQRVTGSINSAGNVVLDYSGSLTMGGFTAANGGLHLRNTGLSADGTFAVRFGSTTFGQVGFSGSVNYNTSNGSVSYSLGRTSGGIAIGGFSIPSPILSLTTAGAAGSATLPFGLLHIPFNNLNITSGGGLSFSQYNYGVDTGWLTFLDIPFTDLGDVRSRLAGSVRFQSSGGTTFTSTLIYSWAPWIITQTCIPLPCVTHYPPSNINSVSAPPRISGSGSISSSGAFTLNTPFGGVSSFPFDLW